jgi:hypothetical protein
MTPAVRQAVVVWGRPVGTRGNSIEVERDTGRTYTVG